VLRRLLPNLYEGWIVTGSFAFVIVLIGATFFWGFGTIFTPVVEEFGWSNASVSFGFALRSEVQGIGAPAIGYLVDRFGPRRVLTAGIVTMAVGLVGLSYMQNLWHFYAAMFVIALGISSAGGPVGMVAVATWFDRRRSRALSFMTVGGGLAGLFTIVVAFLVDTLGWRDALRVLAVVIAVAGSLVALNVRSRPSQHPQPLDGIPDERDAQGNRIARAHTLWGVPPMEVFRSRPFLAVAFGQAALMFAITSIMVHMIPALEAQGVSKAAAASAITVFAVVSIVGRLGFGYLGDKHDKRIVLAVAASLAAAGIPLLAFADSLAAAIVVMLIIGPGFGGVIPVRPALLADYFGTRYFGTVNGLNQLLITIGAFIGPPAVGFVVDRTGEYTIGWLLSGAVAALAIPMMLAATPPRALMERHGPSQDAAAANEPVGVRTPAG
jgi:MFS family permease